MGLEVARSVLESGGDAICVDLPAKPPLHDPWQAALTTATTHSAHLIYHSCDITNSAALNSPFTSTLSHARYPLRGLVTCAGISGEGASIDCPVSSMKRILDINLVGTFACAQAAAREFQRTGSPGSIVLVASISGFGSNRGVDTAAYNASKAGVHQLTRPLAAEWGGRVGMPLARVNSLSPGYIRTRMTAESLAVPEMERMREAGNMLGRLSEADEYRGPVMFLLGDASSFVTGGDLRVDGGHTAW